MSNKKATILLTCVAVMWATSFIFSSIAMDSGMSGVEVVFIRFFIATGLIYLVYRKDLKIKNLEKNAIRAGLISGFVIFLSFNFEMLGIKLSNTTKAGFLTGLNVIIIPFLYFLVYKQKPKAHSLGAGVLTILGVAFLSLKENFFFELGDFFLIITAVFYALYNFSVNTQSKGCSMVQLTFVQFSMVAFCTLFVVPFSRGSGMTGAGIWSTLYLAVIPTFVCYLLKNYILKFISPVRCAIIQSSQSVFCAIFSVLILGDIITPKMYVGIVIIMSAILIEVAYPGLKAHRNRVQNGEPQGEGVIE